MDDPLQLEVQPKTLGKHLHIWSERILSVGIVLGIVFGLLSQFEEVKEFTKSFGIGSAILFGGSLVYAVTYRVFFVFESRLTKYVARPLWGLFLILMIFALAFAGYEQYKKSESNNSTQAIRTAPQSSCLA